MSLIAIAVHDTTENKRTSYTIRTLESLENTVDLNKHRLFIINNDSCADTCIYLNKFQSDWKGSVHVLHNEYNIGTAKAINRAWKFREKGEHCIKMDNDVVINEVGWVEQMENVFKKDPKIGIVGLKRKDVMEDPNSEELHFRTTLHMLPHEAMERWVIVEKSKMIMGTVTMFNESLIDEIGGLTQMNGIYGFDDVLACVRSNLAGYKNVYLPHIDIDHIDVGGTDYTEWKKRYAGEMFPAFELEKQSLENGTKSIFEKL